MADKKFPEDLPEGQTGHESADKMLAAIRALIAGSNAASSNASSSIANEIENTEVKLLREKQKLLKEAQLQLKIEQQLGKVDQDKLLNSINELKELQLARRNSQGKMVYAVGDKELTQEQMSRLSPEEFKRFTDTAKQRAKSGVLEERDTFSIGDLAQAAMRGDIGGVARELTQKGRHQTILAEKIQEKGANAQRALESGWEKGEDGVYRHVAAGGMMTRMGAKVLPGLGKLVGRVPVVAAAIGAQQLFTRTNRLRNAGIEMGQITGGGLAEGVEATRQGIQTSLNPFDRIDRRTGIAISKGVRGAGLTGDLAGDYTDAIGGMVNDLGIEWSQALELAVDSTRKGNMSLGEFRAQMEDLDDTAKKSGSSVKGIVESLNNLQKEFYTRGGSTLQRLAQPIMTTFAESGRGTVIGHDAATRDRILNMNTAEMIGQMSGLSAGEIALPENMKKVLPRLRDFLMKVFNMWKEDNEVSAIGFDEWSQMQYTYNPIFQQMFPGGAADFIAGVKWANKNKTTDFEAKTKEKQNKNLQKSIKHDLKKPGFLDEVMFDLTKSGINPFKKKFWWGTDKNIKYDRVEKEAQVIQDIKNTLGGQGFTTQQQIELTKGLRDKRLQKGEKSSTNHEIEFAMALQEALANLNINIGMSPEARAFLEVQAGKEYRDYQSGTRSSHGLTRPAPRVGTK
jgi:hypothetical protein